jgi:hypothetical protein
MPASQAVNPGPSLVRACLLCSIAESIFFSAIYFGQLVTSNIDYVFIREGISWCAWQALNPEAPALR